MKRLILFFLCPVIAFLLSSQKEKPAYRIFDARGKEISYHAFIAKVQRGEVLLFGELHNNPIAHWLELSCLKDLYASRKEWLIAGAEMFESEDQPLLDQYLKGEVTPEKFVEGADVWNNFETDYQPLLQFSAQHHIPFIATSVPRRYARMVAYHGLPSLGTVPSDEKKWFAPLPIEVDLTLPGYKSMVEENMHGHGMNMKYMAEAQAFKDATMAYFIYHQLVPGKFFIHFNGAYHSDNHEGIYWYLKQKAPALRIVTVSTVEQVSLEALEEGNKGKADYTIVVPEDMTKTY